jgi:3-oxoacyl-[acyl-carrier protein] reductase
VFELTDSVVLVTGASRGIGRAIALEVARAGADVVIHYRAAAARAEALAAEIRGMGVEAITVAGDVGDRRAVPAMVERAGLWKGRLDGLVTSAGIYRDDPITGVGAAEWESVVQTDMEGTFRTIQAAVPYLQQSEHPAVVTISALIGARPVGGGAPFQMAKAAVGQLTRALAIELAPRIRVNCVAPGFIRTDLHRSVEEAPTFHQAVVRATPLGRWGEPEDVAPAVRYLLSPAADWVTGTVLEVDGGIQWR